MGESKRNSRGRKEDYQMWKEGKNADGEFKAPSSRRDVLARPRVLYRWISVLKEVNPKYKDIHLVMQPTRHAKKGAMA